MTAAGAITAHTADIITGTLDKYIIDLLTGCIYRDPIGTYRNIIIRILIRISAHTADILVTAYMGTGYGDLLECRIRCTDQTTGSQIAANINDIRSIGRNCRRAAYISCQSNIADIASAHSGQAAHIVTAGCHIDIMKRDICQRTFCCSDSTNFRSCSGFHRDVCKLKLFTISLQMSDDTNTASSIGRHIKAHIFKCKTIQISGNIRKYGFSGTGCTVGKVGKLSCFCGSYFCSSDIQVIPQLRTCHFFKIYFTCNPDILVTLTKILFSCIGTQIFLPFSNIMNLQIRDILLFKLEYTA